MSHGGNGSGTGDKSSSQFQRVLAAVLRLDIYDSTTAEHQGEEEFEAFMELLLHEVDRGAYPSLIGTWRDEGDAVRVAFANVREGLRCAFLLRNRAQQPVEMADKSSISLKARIVLHFGEFLKTEDNRIKGIEQILVTRLDHAVPPDAIWATEAFADIARHIRADKGYSFEYVGQRELDKDAGTHPCYSVTLTSAGTGGGLLRPYDPIETATQLLDRGDSSSQASAVAVLTSEETQLACNKLMDIALSSDIDLRVRQAALVGLRRCGDYIDIGRIKGAYNDENSPTELRAQLLLALGVSRSENVIDTLASAAASRGPARIREAALLAMHGFSAKLINASVMGALTDLKEVEVCRAACVAAGGYRYMSGDVCEKLNEIALDPALPVGLRSVACEALCSQEPYDELIEMWAALAQGNRLPLTLRSYAIEGLAQSDDPAAVEAVEEVARRINDDLRDDASAVLPAMRAPRRRVRHRTRRPESDIAEVIRLRTRPDEPDEDAG